MSLLHHLRCLLVQMCPFWTLSQELGGERDYLQKIHIVDTPTCTSSAVKVPSIPPVGPPPSTVVFRDAKHQRCVMVRGDPTGIAHYPHILVLVPASILNQSTGTTHYVPAKLDKVEACVIVRAHSTCSVSLWVTARKRRD